MLAQSVEHAAVNRGVIGSSPIHPATQNFDVEFTGIGACAGPVFRSVRYCGVEQFGSSSAS